MAREFGGSSDLDNIVRMYTDVNHETAMRPTERTVRRRLNNNERVFYAVIPKYYGAEN
jgi:DNA/RNA non-specific endonuclease